VFRRLRAARWRALALAGAVALVCAGCGTTNSPKPLGQPARGPILSLVTSLKVAGGAPRGLTQYFPAGPTRSVYATAFLGDLHGANRLVMTWSRQTATGLHVLFSQELPVTSDSAAYSSATIEGKGTLPVGTYQVSASVAGTTSAAYWTVYAPDGTKTADFAHTARPLRPGSSDELPQPAPKVPCVTVQSSTSMASLTDVRMIVTAYCPETSTSGPTRGIVLATMDRNAGQYLVGQMKLAPTGLLTGSFNLNVCDLPGGASEPGTPLYFASIIYYRGNSKNFSGTYVLPAAHLAPVVTIRSSVPANSRVQPGQKIVLHVTGAEPTAFGAEMALHSIYLSDSSGKIIKIRRFIAHSHRDNCGRALHKTISYTYVVPSGAHGPLKLTATAVGLTDHLGHTSISFQVG